MLPHSYERFYADLVLRTNHKTRNRDCAALGRGRFMKHVSDSTGNAVVWFYTVPKASTAYQSPFHRFQEFYRVHEDGRHILTYPSMVPVTAGAFHCWVRAMLPDAVPVTYPLSCPECQRPIPECGTTSSPECPERDYSQRWTSYRMSRELSGVHTSYYDSWVEQQGPNEFKIVRSSVYSSRRTPMLWHGGFAWILPVGLPVTLYTDTARVIGATRIRPKSFARVLQARRNFKLDGI